MLHNLYRPAVTFAALTTLIGIGLVLPSSVSASQDTPSTSSATAAAGPATHWSRWKKLPKPPSYTAPGCGNKLTFTTPIWQGQDRFRIDADGNQRFQSRGTIHVRINPTHGHTIIADVSGPSAGTFFQNGDVYLRAHGLNEFGIPPKVYKQSTHTRLPAFFLSTGSWALYEHTNGTPRLGDDEYTFLNLPTRYWNLCPVLKSGVVPKPFRT
jgi:uncharacterized protein YraI